VVSPLDGLIKKQIAQGFNGKLKTGKIRRYKFVMDERGDQQPLGYTDYPFQGIRQDFDASYRVRAGIPETDVRILVILGLTATTPEQGDKMFINDGWYEVRRVLSIDPAGASASLQAYGIANG